MRPTQNSISVKRTAVPIVIALLAALTLALQAASGAYHAEFGSDEASHYVSGLMLHDYLLSGLAQSPLAYLRIFHSHYPLVGIGHWPPLYYAVEAGWMLVFGTDRVAVLLLSATVTLTAAILLYAFLARRFGPFAACVAAAIFVASPIVQDGTNTLMLDIPVAALCLLATLAYGRYLDHGRARDSAAFALFALAAIMVKGNGACLALLPPCAILIGRRFDLLRKPSFWLPVPIVGLLAGPWYVLTYGNVAAGFRYPWGFGYLAAATAGNIHALLGALGAAVVLLAVVGFIAVVLRPPRPPAEAGIVAAAALFASIWIFQSLVPSAIEARYLAPALPPLLILALHGLDVVSTRLIGTQRHPGLWQWGTSTLVGVSFLISAAGLTTKSSSGIIQAVQQIIAHPVTGNPAVLVAADAPQEAEAVAEIALQDHHRPNLFAIRGSRLLGGGGYNNQDYEPRFHDAIAAMAAIDEQNIPLVLFRADGHPLEWQHLHQIEEARIAHPERWQLIGEISNSTPVLLFKITGNGEKQANIESLINLSAPNGLRSD